MPMGSYGSIRTDVASIVDHKQRLRRGAASDRRDVAAGCQTHPMTTRPRPLSARLRLVLVAVLTAMAALLSPALHASASGLPAAETRVGAIGPTVTTVVGVAEHIAAGQRRSRAPSQLQLVSGHCVAAEAGAGETTTLYRAVGQGEADDIAAVSGYRNAPGLEGKYFFRTREQAEQYGQMMNKTPGFGAPNYLTSGSVPTRALGSAEGLEAGTEGPGLFFRGDLGDFFDVLVHGLIP